MRGADFANHLSADVDEREKQVLDAVRDGVAHIEWVPLDLREGAHHVTVFVSADAFAVGEPADYFRPSLRATTLQIVADMLRAMLPTSKIVDEAHHQASVRVEPFPRAPGPDMGSTRWMIEQNAKVTAAIGGRRGLTSTVGKDWVLTPRLVGRPDLCANYGWPSEKATLVNPYNGLRVYQTIGCAHNRWHVDYSQVGRLVLRECVVDGVTRDLGEVLKDPVLCKLVSDEGVVLIDRLATSNGPEERLAQDAANRLTPPVPYKVVTRTLREGSTGPDVIEWQKIIGATADGIFGAGTKKKTVAWQAAHGLVADGIVGPASWATARAGTTAPVTTNGPTPEPVTVPTEKLPFKQAKHYRSTNGRKIDLVVLHTMENAEKPDSAEAVANWFASAGAPKASAHYCCDSDSIVSCVYEKDIAYAAPGANGNGVQIEMAGRARQSAEDWADPYSQTMLRRVARLTADICKTHDIPVEFVDVAGLSARPQGRGITTHNAVSKAFKQSDHYDPGPNFPMEQFLAAVREFSEG